MVVVVVERGVGRWREERWDFCGLLLLDEEEEDDEEFWGWVWDGSGS